jgi:hypothetical protein
MQLRSCWMCELLAHWFQLIATAFLLACLLAAANVSWASSAARCGMHGWRAVVAPQASIASAASS